MGEFSRGPSVSKKIALFTITDSTRISSGELDNFLSSFSTNAFSLFLGVRNSPNYRFPSEVDGSILHLPLEISLSKARNLLLEKYLSEVSEVSYIFFLDDDATLATNFNEEFQKILYNPDFMVADIRAKNIKSTQGFEITKNINGLDFLLRNASSNNLLIRKDVFMSFRFDEKLGLGTPMIAGEDLDLAVSLIVNEYIGTYEPSLNILHPQNANNRPYFFASVAVLLKHRKRYPAVWILIIRRISSGVVRTFFGRIDVLNIKILRLAFRNFY
jgi:hypothetical protein